MKNPLKNLFQYEFVRNSSILLSGNVIAQIVALITYPIITRIYTPEIYGAFNYFIVVATVLALIPTGKYELAILLPKSERKASALFYLSGILNIVFFFLLFILVLFFHDEINYLLSNGEETTPLLAWLLPFFVFLYAGWQILNRYLLRKKKFKNITTYNVTQNLSGSLLKILLGLKGFLQTGLIFGQLIAVFLANLISILLGKKSLKSLQRVKKKDLIEVAKEYTVFPKYELPNQVISSLSSSLPVLLLAFYFDKGYIGIYSMAFNIGFMAVTLFSQSISQVLFQRMSEKKRENKDIHRDCVTFCKYCFLYLLPVFILLLFLPESFFTFIFGDKWTGVTLYFKLLIPVFFMSLVVASLSFIPDVFLKQKTAMKIEIVYLILKAVSLFIGILSDSFMLAIICYAIIVVLMLSVKLIWYLRLTKEYELMRPIDD